MTAADHPEQVTPISDDERAKAESLARNATLLHESWRDHFVNYIPKMAARIRSQQLAIEGTTSVVANLRAEIERLRAEQSQGPG